MARNQRGSSLAPTSLIPRSPLAQARLGGCVCVCVGQSTSYAMGLGACDVLAGTEVGYGATRRRARPMREGSQCGPPARCSAPFELAKSNGNPTHTSVQFGAVNRTMCARNPPPRVPGADSVLRGVGCAQDEKEDWNTTEIDCGDCDIGAVYTCWISDLQADTLYAIQVRASNGGGLGACSPAVTQRCCC
eukprot:1520149-Rhodomonas_salina.4